jgi:hypothetical protein
MPKALGSFKNRAKFIQSRKIKIPSFLLSTTYPRLAHMAKRETLPGVRTYSYNIMVH